jgi:hypothetical protein
LHWRLAAIGAKPGLSLHPVGTLFGNGALGELVLKPNFEVSAVKAALALRFRDVEFTALFSATIGYLAGGKRR